MKYENEIIQKLDLVNSVLKSLDVKPLLINEDFILDGDFHQEHYVKLLLNKPNCIKLEMVFINNALQINIDRINESFEWSEKQIKENGNEIKDLIKIIFTTTIKVKYCGSNYTKIYFIDNNNNCIKTLKYVTGLYLKIGCTTKEYQPLYTK